MVFVSCFRGGGIQAILDQAERCFDRIPSVQITSSFCPGPVTRRSAPSHRESQIEPVTALRYSTGWAVVNKPWGSTIVVRFLAFRPEESTGCQFQGCSG